MLKQLLAVDDYYTQKKRLEGQMVYQSSATKVSSFIDNFFFWIESDESDVFSS